MNYFCNEHKCNLKHINSKFLCSIGNHSYSIDTQSIPILDDIRSEESFHFDKPNSIVPIYSQNEINSFEPLAAIFLRSMNPRTHKNLNILDVACGKGELSLYLATQVFPDANFYCFDHSYTAIQHLAKTIDSLGIKNIHPSLQDINALKYGPSSFDYIYGNAVLHHFLDWEGCLRMLCGLLKPGGKLIFSEPFYQGYLILINVIALTIKSLNLSIQDIERPEYGLLNFIINDITSRINQCNKKDFLKSLIDKHLFCTEDFIKFANSNGFIANFKPYEDSVFYSKFMSIFLNSYEVKDPKFCQLAEDNYQIIYSSFESQYSKIYPHFQMIELERGGK